MPHKRPHKNKTDKKKQVFSVLIPLRVKSNG